MKVSGIYSRKFNGRILLLAIITIVSIIPLEGQNNSENTALDNGKASFLIHQSVNLTHSPKLSSQSIDGEWGLKFNYIFPKNRIGFSTSLIFDQIHVGKANEFTSPDKATGFKLFTMPLEVIFIPFKSNDKFQLSAGLSYGLVLDHNFRNGSLPDYNVFIKRLNIEYKLIDQPLLNITSGLGYRNYNLHNEFYGSLHTVSLYFDIGLNSE